MRLIERKDTSLAVGLVVGTILLFHEPLQFAFDIADDLRRRYDIDLVQALVVLAVVFGFHQYRKRLEARTDAVTAAAEARYAKSRSEALERLVTISRTLAGIADFPALARTLVRHLPEFIGERDHSVVVCAQGSCDVLVRDHAVRSDMERWEAAAVERLRRSIPTVEADAAAPDLLTIPLLDGTQPIGVILVHNAPPLASDARASLEAVATFAALTIRNIQMLLDTRDRSARDGLTGCFNRAHALSAATLEIRRARRHNRPLSLVMFDVDRFKEVNDTCGHLAGDHLLAEIGRRLEEVVRMTDIKCRYGGDEFLVLLPDTPLMGAQHVAESLRTIMSSIELPVGPGSRSLSPTVSVGVATLRPEDRDLTPVIARADRALYEAKQRGRNCVAVDRTPEDAPLRLVAQNPGPLGLTARSSAHA